MRSTTTAPRRCRCAGLGPGSTLVLINGRRVAPFGFTGRATFVDLNQIPVSAIDRIEVLLDGASAIYGSDAIAGVVNVIMRRGFSGVEVAAGLGRSSHGDATERRASATFGIGDRAADGYNVFASVSHADQDAVKASERWHSQSGDYRGFGLIDARSPYSYPGNLYSADNRTFLQPLAPCATIGDAASANPGRCLYDPSLAKDIIVRSRRDGLFAAGSAALGAGFELFGDAAVARTVFTGQHSNFASSIYGPAGTGTLATPFIALPVGHPQNPYPVEVALRTRFADQPFVVTPTSDTQRAVVGVRRGDWEGWDVESALLWSKSSTRVTTAGVIHDAVLAGEVLDANGRASPSFRFGDPGANDPALMARLYPTLVDTGRTSTTSIDVRGSREVLRLPAGPAQLALGAELRRERYESAYDPLTAAGDIGVIFGTSASGSRNVGSAYAELALTITASLEATLAARWDHYSDFGSTTNPKAGLKWKVSPGVALRAYLRDRLSRAIAVRDVPRRDTRLRGRARSDDLPGPRRGESQLHFSRAGELDRQPGAQARARAQRDRRHRLRALARRIVHRRRLPDRAARPDRLHRSRVPARQRVVVSRLRRPQAGRHDRPSQPAVHQPRRDARLGNRRERAREDDGRRRRPLRHRRQLRVAAALLGRADGRRAVARLGRLLRAAEVTGACRAELRARAVAQRTHLPLHRRLPARVHAVGHGLSLRRRRPSGALQRQVVVDLDLFVGYTPTPSLEFGLAVNNLGNVQAPFDERSRAATRPPTTPT
jgi:hypothetical protein